MSPLATTYVTVTEQPAICEPLSEGRPEAILQRVRMSSDLEARIPTVPTHYWLTDEQHHRVPTLSRHPVA